MSYHQRERERTHSGMSSASAPRGGEGGGGIFALIIYCIRRNKPITLKFVFKTLLAIGCEMYQVADRNDFGS